VWPSSITSIPVACFYGCSSLKNITIPEGVTTIGPKTFYDCTSLKYMEIPSTLNTNGSSAFSYCTINVNAEKNTNIEIVEGLLFVNEKTTLIEYFGTNSTITIPSHCTVVENSVFLDKNINSVVFKTISSLELKNNVFQKTKITS
jgi:hypothetical protein